MEKMTVNFQILAMNKLVKQGRIHIINRLTKEMKLLKKKKGNEAQTVKYKRKAERLLSEISLLKKVSVDSVSKMCLLSEVDWKSKISNATISLEDRAMARLANVEAVQKEALKFRTNFPKLVNDLADLFQEWDVNKASGKNRERRAAQRKFKKEKAAKKLHAKEHENNVIDSDGIGFPSEGNESSALENNNVEGSCKDNVDNFESDFKNMRTSDNEVGSSDQEQKEQEEGEKVKENLNECVDDVSASNCLKNSTLKECISNTTETSVLKSSEVSTNIMPVQKQCAQEAKESGLNEVISLNSEELMDCDIPCKEVQVEDVDQTKTVNGEKRKRDPFFLGSSGEDESDGGDSDDEKNDSAEEHERFPNDEHTHKSTGQKYPNKSMANNRFSTFRKQDWKSNRQDFSGKPGQKFKRQDFKSSKRNSSFSSKGPSNEESGKMGKKANSSHSGKKANSSHSDEKKKELPMHPSWAAKMKQKQSSVVVFQGKKTVF